jgi:hypothetical protein
MKSFSREIFIHENYNSFRLNLLTFPLKPKLSNVKFALESFPLKTSPPQKSLILEKCHNVRNHLIGPTGFLDAYFSSKNPLAQLSYGGKI